MFLDGLNAKGATFGFTDHAEQAGFLEHHLGELIHARRRGRTGRADDFIAHRIDRTDVINKATPKIDPLGQCFAARKDFLNSLMCGITPSQHCAG